MQTSGVRGRVKHYPYEDILADLEQVLLWYTERRIKVSKRLNEHRGVLMKACEAWSKNGTIPARSPAEVEALFLALTEVMEVIRIWSELHDDPDTSIQGKLKAFIRGSRLPADERGGNGSSHARDIGFELNLASRLKRSGLRPILDKPCDVSAKMGEKTLLIECKRPRAKKTVGRRLKEARRELSRCIAKATSPRKPYGLVAISMTKVFNPGDRILEVPDTSHLEPALYALITEFKNEHREHFLSQRRRRILGILVHLAIPAFIRQARQPAGCEQLGYFPFSEPGTQAYRFLMESKDMLDA